MRQPLFAAILPVLWSLASNAATPVDPSSVAGAACYGWSTTDDAAFVARQKETCGPDGCELGAYLARVGPSGGARTVKHIGYVKSPAGRATPAAIVASAKPKFVQAASEAVAAATDAGCVTEQPTTSFDLAGHGVSVRQDGTSVVVELDGRAIPAATLAATPLLERLDAVHYSPGWPALVLRIVGESDAGIDVRFVHLSAKKLGLAAPVVAPRVTEPVAEPAPAPPSDPVAAPLRTGVWPITGCVGWSTTARTAYVVRERQSCDESNCQRSAALVEVTPKKASAVRAFYSLEASPAELAAPPVPPAKIAAVLGSMKADVGCATGRRGALADGHTFEVSESAAAGERSIQVAVDGGAPAPIGVLADRERTEDAFGDVTPALTERVVGVYSHPSVAAIVVEVSRQTESGFDSRFVFVEGDALRVRALRVVPSTANETPEAAAATRLTLLSVPMVGRRCLGWNTAAATAYVVQSTDYCVDAGGLDCTASVSVQSVSSASRASFARLASASGDSAALEGRLTRAASDSQLDAVGRKLEGVLDQGCVVGLTGSAGGQAFEVSVDDRAISLAVAGGAPRKVHTLPKDHDDEDSGHYARHRLEAVYSHPAIPALVLEVVEQSDRGTKPQLVYLRVGGP